MILSTSSYALLLMESLAFESFDSSKFIEPPRCPLIYCRFRKLFETTVILFYRVYFSAFGFYALR